MKIIIDKNFTLEQKRVIENCLELAKNKYDIQDKINVIEIINCGRLKTSGGNALTNRTQKYGKIKMNKRLFRTTVGINEFKNTFSHELSHIVANFLKGRQCGHNRYWQSVHKSLEGNGKRCHDYDVNHLKPKRKTYTYTCGCNTFELSSVRHNKILKGAKYSCKKCKQTIFRQFSHSVIIEKFL